MSDLEDLTHRVQHLAERLDSRRGFPHLVIRTANSGLMWEAKAFIDPIQHPNLEVFARFASDPFGVAYGRGVTLHRALSVLEENLIDIAQEIES